MNRDQRGAILERLIYDEEFKSLAIPTVRAGRRIVVSAVISGDALDGTDDMIEPDKWFAVDHDSGDIVGFGASTLWSPVAGNWRTLGELHRDYTPPEPGNPREAIAVIQTSWGRVVDAFFSGSDLDPEECQRVNQAVLRMIPKPLHAWLFACCADFWTWLASAGGEGNKV